jgi:hypothetical protein
MKFQESRRWLKLMISLCVAQTVLTAWDSLFHPWEKPTLSTAYQEGRNRDRARSRPAKAIHGHR